MESGKKFSHSVVIPVFNEEKNLNELYKRLTLVMEKLGGNYEIIFVDDGSKDKSLEMLKSLHAKDQRVKIISFTRNFGHHIAIIAGLNNSQGDAVVLMDGDLQDPPEEIRKLESKFKEGYDVVYAIRKTRKDTFFKKLNSKIFYAIFKYIGNVDIPSNTGIFRIVSRRVVEYIKNCPEISLFVVALIGWAGFSTVGVETDRHARYAGESKYSFLKSMKLAVNAVVSFSSFPIHLITYSGLLFAMLGFAAGFYMLIEKVFFNAPIVEHALIIVFLFFIGGIQLISVGAIGEYTSRVYTEVRKRPFYVVNEKIGLNN